MQLSLTGVAANNKDIVRGTEFSVDARKNVLILITHFNAKIFYLELMCNLLAIRYEL